jgi:RNA polymerase sigma-70 factor (ECF subfamily)
MEVRADAEPVGSAPERLLHRVARGDHSAFTELVAAHDSDMVRLCFLISSDAELARDATQNAWQRLWSKPPRLRDESKLRSWLLSVAANEARQMIRRRGIGRVREIQAESRSASLDNERSDDRLDLQAVLSRLEPADRELLGLRFLFDMSSDQIGAHLGISAEGARTRLHRLLVRIRRELGIE